MKYAAILLLLAGLCGCDHKASTAPASRDYTVIFLDNIGYQDDGDEFAAAFASTPTCSGLSLVLYTDHRRDFALHRNYGWKLSYAHLVPEVALTALDRVTTDAWPNIIKDGGSRSPAEAAKWVCFVVKEQGGSIR